MCEQAADCLVAANGNTCQNGGTAVGKTGSCRCNCVFGFLGSNCETQTTTITSTTITGTTTTATSTTITGTTTTRSTTTVSTTTNTVTSTTATTTTATSTTHTATSTTKTDTTTSVTESTTTTTSTTITSTSSSVTSTTTSITATSTTTYTVTTTTNSTYKDMLAALARKKTAKTTSSAVVTVFLLALISGIVFVVYRRKVAARNAALLNDLKHRAGMNVNNPMYEAPSLDPAVKGTLVDVSNNHDNEFNQVIGFTRKQSVYIESTTNSLSSSADGANNGAAAKTKVVFAIPMDDEYLDVDNAAVAEVAVVEPPLPQAAGRAAVDLLQPGSTASMRSIVLQGFSVPMEEEHDPEGEQQQEQKQQLEDAEDALPSLVLTIPMEVTDDESVPPLLPRKERYNSVC